MKTITHNGVPCVEARVNLLKSDVRMRNVNDPEGLVYSDGWAFKDSIPQHLYITDDSEIKEGDWFITDDENQDLMHAVGAQWRALCKYDGLIEMSRKVVATTDPKLTLQNELDAYYKNGIGGGNKIAQIPQSFIEEYCKASGIDKVMVEFEFFRKLEWEDIMEEQHLKPKTDFDNCITIHPVGNNLLRECLNAIEFLSDEVNTNQYSELIKRIEENL
jgi:hypothetical protein